MNRTLDTFKTKPPSRDEVEIQVSVVDGTPMIWACEGGRSPTIIRGVKALSRLQESIGKALECARSGERLRVVAVVAGPRPT